MSMHPQIYPPVQFPFLSQLHCLCTLASKDDQEDSGIIRSMLGETKTISNLFVPLYNLQENISRAKAALFWLCVLQWGFVVL